MQSIIKYIFQDKYMFVASAFLLSLLISYTIYPVILYLNHKKHLSQIPNKRSTHIVPTPTLGGVPIYIAFMIATSIFSVFSYDHTHVSNIIALRSCLTIVFFSGIKDDLIGVSYKKKLITQIIAASLLLILTHASINNLQGLFNIYTLPNVYASVFTVFVFVIIINSYNLIDGIDGLASSFAIICSIAFGIFFIINNAVIDSLISFSITGCLIIFFINNISKKRKIFMGDSGSMTVGFILAYQLISFINVNQLNPYTFFIKNTPVVVFALFSFPVIDTCRIFIIRLINKKPPFKADNNHLHHKLLRLGLSHLKATLVVFIYTTVITSIAIALQNLNINIHFLSILIISICLISIPFFISHHNSKYKLSIPCVKCSHTKKHV